MKSPKLALVATGGMLKGVSHLGVLKAMQELGLDVDIFVGASSGALVGACYANHIPIDEMIDWFLPWYKQSKEYKDRLKTSHLLGWPSLEQWTKPNWLCSGLLSIDSLEQYLSHKLPENDFRHLRLSLFITATDIDARGRVVFGKGYMEDIPISKAVAASSCIPLLFRPYHLGNRYYIDGELVKTLSIDLAVDAGANIVIISNVYRPARTKNGRSFALKGPFALARQSLNILLSEKEKRGIDLIHERYPNLRVLQISPDLGRFPFTSKKNTHRFYMRGYREALQVLTAAKRRGLFSKKTISVLPPKP